MDQPFSQVLSEKFECPVEEVHSLASDQNDCYSGKSSESSKSRCRQQTVSLGISPNYVKQWDTTAAFRELYQNWKDAIFQSFQLDRLEFQPIYENKRDCISITVQVSDPSRPEGHRTLGFIKYEKRAGRVILVNSCASLRPDDLQLGQTSKEGNIGLAGHHGEGLKLGAIVMSREGYKVYMAADGCDWSFRNRGSLNSQFCCVIRPSKHVNASRYTDPATDMAQLHSRIERDVTVTIGPERNKRRKKVTMEIFKKWLEVSLDIRGLSYPAHIIETGVGDIILDKSFSGKVYYKGILLLDSTTEAASYKMGYNFLTGITHRGRLETTSKEEQSNLVRQLWEAAIGQDEAILPIYVDLLWNSPGAPDVERADHLLETRTRSLIWKYLLMKTNGEQFYYSETCHVKDVEMIRNDLNRDPVKIPQSLWALLRTTSQIRTAEEEQIAMFNSAPACSVPNSSFAMTVQRALKSGISLYDSTKHIKISFVHARNNSTDAFFDLEHQMLKVHHRWLDFDAMHREYPCRDQFPVSMTGPNAPFFCDHIVEELLRKALPTIFRLVPMTRETENGVIRQIRQRLRQMPHSIKLERASQLSGLAITWEDNETESFRKAYRSRVGYHVVLHEERCASARSELLHGEAVTFTEGRAPCGCPELLATSQCNRRVVFTDLDCSRKYFPMIALNQQSAFYGPPPEPIGLAEIGDLVDYTQHTLCVQDLPIWAEPCPPNPATSSDQPQHLLSYFHQAQRELFIRHNKRQKKDCD